MATLLVMRLEIQIWPERDGQVSTRPVGWCPVTDPYRADRYPQEREALLAELPRAVGRAGRDRRLGDERQRARKSVTAGIRDILSKIEHVHAPLAGHLQAAIRTSTW